MFENKGDDAQVKVIDFGLSKKFLDNRIGIMYEGVGEWLWVCLCVGMCLACVLNSTSSNREQ